MDKTDTPRCAWYGIDCGSRRQSRGTKINVGGGVGQSFSSMVGTIKSQSIGIPETEISRNVGQQNGILSRAFFQEITVPAGLPMNVRSSLIIMGSAYDTRCNTKIGSFVPEAGKDYKIVGVVSERKCGITAFEVAQDGSTTPVEWNARAVCSKRQ